MANDKNLYRSIRLGRIVNLNGRVIGSIVKRKEKEKESAKMARKDGRGEEAVIGNGKRTKWEVRWRKFEGWLGVVSIIFYPKTAPSLRRAILLICKGASEKMGWQEIRI